MNIKKIGHCCLLIKIGNLTILTDPGNYTEEQNTLTGIDVVLITHEHADHFHIDSLKKIIENNPHVKVITNTAVGKKLDQVNIAYQILEGQDEINFLGVDFKAYDHRHAEIFDDYGQVQNTGYFIAGELFYPGDAFCIPHNRTEQDHINTESIMVKILALPVAGPWCKFADALRYAIAINPKYVFPVHDGMIRPERIENLYKIAHLILQKNDIPFIGREVDNGYTF